MPVVIHKPMVSVTYPVQYDLVMGTQRAERRCSSRRIVGDSHSVKFVTLYTHIPRSQMLNSSPPGFDFDSLLEDH